MRVAAVAVTTLVLAGCGVGTAPAPPVRGTVKVVATAADEEAPVAGSGAVAWQESRKPGLDPTRPRTVVYVRIRGRTVRVNPAGTYAGSGGIDGGRMALQIIRGGVSRLALYDLVERRLVALPRWVNDGAWLWKPDLDGHRLLYGAVLPGTKWPERYQVRLADLRTHRVRVLVDLDVHNPYAAPGQLRGRWASWFTCVENFCNVAREDLTTGRIASPPNRDEPTHYQMAPAIDPRGVLYFERASTDCSTTEVERWNGRTTSVVLRLPRGVGYRNAYLARGTHVLYLDPMRCDSSAGSDVVATARAVG